jgi:ATP-dependent DNA helicase Q4
MNEIKHGRVEILLVSPEAVVSSEKSTGFGAILKQLPPIAFACIDEAHCVSQWSHNFRPSYLMICRVLRDKLGVNTVLGLTATATLQTRRNIVDHLAIPDGLDGIISDTPLPNNLVLTISKDENRDKALLELLRSDRFKSLQSVIIYCTRRDECERIAGFLRTCLQDSGAQQGHGKKRKRTTWFSEAYHAGMVASRRRTIQNAFMKGELRIVVATIAFGMGINLSNIRGIIHFNMPKSFENYVQEVGRAGRDGKTSHCHVFLSSRGEDLSELRRHIYANAVDRHVIRKLIKKIFIPCSCKNRLKDEKETSMCTDSVEKSDRICPGHEVCFSIEETVQSLDIPEENIATLLCYLELHEDRYIKVLGNAYTKCKIISYSGAGYMKQMAKSCPPLAMAIALELKKRNDNDLSSIEFCVVDVASAIGWDSGVVKYQLKQLEWTNTNGSNRRSPLTVTFSDVGFRIRAPGDLTDDELDRALDLLQMRTEAQERNQLVQV